MAVTGDSDLVPAFEFARREGLRVFLCHLGHGIKRELKAHADRTMRIELPSAMTLQHGLEDAASRAHGGGVDADLAHHGLCDGPEVR